MPLPEYVVTAGGPVVLVLVVLRFGPDAFLRLLAGTVAILTCPKDKRSERSLDVLRILRGRDQLPPSLPSDCLPERLSRPRAARGRQSVSLEEREGRGYEK